MRPRGIATTVLVLAAGLLIASPALAGISKVSGGIEFTYEDPSAGSVSLAGDFNNWNMNAEPLTQGDDGVWRVVVALDPGTYEYKFVVNGSEWIADPENPVVVGDYGNSGLTIDDDGEPVASAAASAISNTPANSRVMLNGWYRATYDTQSDVPSDPRWRLNRPAHELYLQVNPTVTSVASGSATVYMSTGTGDYKEISLDLYSGWATLEGGPFDVTGFYNEEILQFDNPLETVGHMDLYGTIAEEHIPFGRGAQGIMLDTGFWDVTATAAYTNIYDLDYLNDPGRYDNTGTDLIAARLKRPVGPAVIGATYTSWKDGWWIGFEGSNTSPDIDEYLEDHPQSESTWFEMSNTESWIGLDVAMPVVEGMIDAKAEYARYGFESLWDVGNKEKVEGEDLSNGAIDVPIGEVSGWAGKLVLEGTPVPTLDLSLEVTKIYVEGMEEDELFVSFYEPMWPVTMEGQFTEVTGTGSPLTVGVYDPTPERDELLFEFDAGLAVGIFGLGLEFDRASFEWTYLEEVTGDYDSEPTKVWEETWTRFAGRADAAINERIDVGFALESISYDQEATSVEPSTFETIFTAGVGLWQDWGLELDVRNISYEDIVRLGDESYYVDDESFFAPYVGLVYEPRENVELRVGYGVNPTQYTDTPVAGRPNGRARWRSEYLWEHSGHDMLDAEEALSDAKTIGVMAVLTF